MKQEYFLSVDMRTGEPKVGKRQPRPQFGVAVFTLELNIPDTWDNPVGKISLDLPEPPDKSIVKVYDALGLMKCEHHYEEDGHCLGCGRHIDE